MRDLFTFTYLLFLSVLFYCKSPMSINNRPMDLQEHVEDVDFGEAAKRYRGAAEDHWDSSPGSTTQLLTFFTMVPRMSRHCS